MLSENLRLRLCVWCCLCNFFNIHFTENWMYKRKFEQLLIQFLKTTWKHEIAALKLLQIYNTNALSQIWNGSSESTHLSWKYNYKYKFVCVVKYTAKWLFMCLAPLTYQRVLRLRIYSGSRSRNDIFGSGNVRLPVCRVIIFCRRITKRFTGLRCPKC